MSAPLTKTQYGLYAECVSNEGKACYNIPYCYTLGGNLDGERLCRAIERAVAAHPALFTRIAVGGDDEPVQRIDSQESFTLKVEEIDDIEAVKAAFIQPFSLLKDRLFRIRLLKDKEHFYLLQDIHHIISDGTSRQVLLADIQRAYNGEPLESEVLTQMEVAEKEAELRGSPAFEEGKKWYAQHFDCGDCYSPLLPDLDGTAVTEAKQSRTMQVDEARIEDFCREKGIFKSTFFTAVYAYLLAKFNNEQQALFSSIHNGRSDHRLAHSVAMLVKTFPVYAQFTDETSVLDFLKACQEQTSGCREHEAYSYSDAVSDLGLQIATMFAWHGHLFDSREFCGKPMSAERLNNNTLEVPLYVKGYLRDGRCCIEAEYSAEVHSTGLVSQFLESYEAVAEGFLSKEYLREIDLSTSSQMDLLDRFNETDIPYDDTQTIVSLFRRQAKATPRETAVVFKDKTYTYAEVDDISDRIAATLAAKGLGAEDVVSILIPRCEWMVIASLGVSKAGCAYQPLDPSYPKERLNFMMQDAGAQVLIADEALRPIVEDFKGDVLLTKDLTSLPAADKLPEGPKPGSLFILLYTSGSTGVPKGCQLIHSNLVCFCHWYQRYFDLKPGNKVAAYASYGFDVCMMDMYCGLTCGAPIYIIPEEMRLDLVALNDYFEKEAITHAFMTTQVAYQFATSMENRSLMHLSTGGEKLASLAPPKGYRFHNGYGPTETTVFTTIYRVDEKRKDIPIGKPLDNLRLYIVDGRGQRLPVGAVGELWVAGPQVSRGYLNRPEKTAEVYIANPFTQEEKFARIYKTGDIVRYLPSGDIQFVGRRDGQVKIRGFRIELKEVEAIIREFPGIKDATVQAFDEENGSGKFIAAYIVSDQSVDVEALNNFILEQKPPYMVPAVTMQIDAIPLNQNFKVNKRALPKPEKKVEAVESVCAPMNVLENELFEMIAAIAGNREFGITTVLGNVGLTSISAIKLAVQANKRFGVSLDAKMLVKSGTLQSIENEILERMMSGEEMGTGASGIGTSADAAQTAAPKAAGPVSIPLSYAQTGVYFDCLKNPSSTVYNIPYSIAFPEGTDAQTVAEALRTLVASHPQLTVHFGDDGSDIVQTTQPDQPVEIPVKTMGETEFNAYKHAFVRPFDLAAGPLYRFELVQVGKKLHLLCDVHHLVFDGSSFDLILQQLCGLMNGEALEEEVLNYAGYVKAEKASEGGPEYQAAQEWFKSRLEGCKATTEVPSDLAAPHQGAIDAVWAELDLPAINTFARAHNLTPAHLILAATYYALSRFADSEDLCIATISSGRSDLRIRNTVGMFVNTLAISAHIGKQSIGEFLQEVSANFDETLRHENYPFARIAADFGLSAEIFFVYQLGVISQYLCNGAPLELENLELKVPKCPIMFYIKEVKGVPGVYLEYDNGRYSARLMQALADAIPATAKRMTECPDEALSTLDSLILEAAPLRNSPAFEEGKKWYAQNFDCGDCYSPLLPDLDGTAATEVTQTRTMQTDMARVDAYCRKNGLSQDSFFTAVYAYLLAKFNNEQQALFSCPAFPVYVRFTDETSVLDFLKACREQMNGCREHEAYSYSDAVSDLGLQVATMFGWHGDLSDKDGGKPVSATLEVPLYIKGYLDNGQCCIEAEYSAEVYSAELVSQFLESYEAVVEGFLSKEYLREIDLSTPSQMDLLDRFNETDIPYDDTQTIVSLFRRQAKATPDQPAVIFKDRSYTYAEVDDISDRIAATLAAKGLGAEDVVSILIPRCEWMVIASLGVSKAGCAYQPLDPSYPKERLNFMMQDANAKVLIADEDLRPIVNDFKGDVLLTRDLTSLPAATTLPEGPKPGSLFILLYTSGSTGVPKGCQLMHSNLVCFCHWYQRYFDLKPGHKVAAYASYGFDVCMMDMYCGITCGVPIYIIPQEMRLDLVALNDYFEQESITHAFITTQVAHQFATSMENHSLQHLCTAGEKLASLTPPKGYHLHNGYGPTETTVLTTIYRVDEKLKDIPIGKPLDNLRLYIVDGRGQRLPVGAVGELWVAGPQVSRGYLNRPEKTAEVYIANPFTQEEKFARIYKTGDIVRYLPSGDIQFIGRRDGQVKIRGFRIELKEVEAIIREFPGIKDATVQAFDEENGSGKFIAAYIVGDQPVDIEALNNFILEQKPPYMVPAVTMQIDAIPLNQNFKVNKRALPKPEKKVEAVEATAAPMSLLQTELFEMIAAIAGNREFGITTILGKVGLTSISAIKLAVQAKKRFGVSLDATTLVKDGTIQSIENEIYRQVLSGGGTAAGAQGVASRTGASSDSAQSATAKATDASADTTSQADGPVSVPLSYAQTGVYFDCLKNPSTPLYNIPYCIAFPKGTEAQAVAEALRTLVASHPQLTVHFGDDGSDIVQTTAPDQPVEIPFKTMDETAFDAYKHAFVRPFDLAAGPLYRFELVQVGNQLYLLSDVHHLVFDGASLDLFLQQLCSLLNGEALEGEELSYADFVRSEKAAEGGPDYQAAQEWFKSRLANCEAATEIPSDLAEPVKGTIGNAWAELDGEAIDAFARDNNITPAHLILAATYYALSRFSNSEDLCITTVSNGRADLRISNTVGMFVNTLALSAHIGKQSVREFLQEVSADFDETLRHKSYPFARIAADYGLTAEIQFVYQRGVISQYRCNGTPLELESFELNVPKFPITFFIKDVKGVAGVCVEYDNGRYSARLMQALADAIRETTRRMMEHPDEALTSLSLLSEEEERRIIQLGTGKELNVDLSETFAGLFTRQAARTPDAPAVVDKDSQLTYGEMDRYSNALARRLIDFGVQPDDFVCVMLDRVKEFPLAVLSIHKAGAAYTPLDFEYPNERLSYMLDNSESKALITSHAVLEAKLAEGGLETAAARLFFIDDFMAEVTAEGDGKAFEPIDLSRPDGLAYMIYTSGSTGKPKGAMLHQAGLRNFIAVVVDMEKLTAADRISGHRSFSFDAHIEDMYPVLTLGGSFHIMPSEIRKDLGAIRQFLFDHQITGGGYSTAMTCLLLGAFDDLPIRFTTGGGEKMSGVYSDHIEIINVYGPTECTDDTSYYSIAPGARIENIPIGQSVANNWNFIVDKAGHLVPQGVAGELCFAGIQVGRGYWRLPERTAQSFVDCPFVQEDRWGRPVRMYHTGDLCRWNEDGQLEYLGRIDTQVKLRGFRIELGEIENKALQIGGIRQAAAEVRKVMGNEHLVLYYTLEEGSTLSEEAIQKALADSSLADYMVPDAYMRLEVMPMTPNLKINRKALPAPELKRAGEFVAPEGEMETLFAQIFSDVLQIKQVGATDNFFEIGGTSINAIKVIVEAGKKGVQLVFNDLFEQKTPRALAAYLGETNEAQAAGGSQAASGQAKADATQASGGSQANGSAADDDSPYAGLNAMLSSNTLAAMLAGERQSIGDVLLTGATGYLGIHILNELLLRYDGRIICPVRAKSDEDALRRLKTLFFYYFGQTEDFRHLEERVSAFAADILQPDGLKNIGQEGLTVVNCVANVKHFSAGNDIETVNIESVRQLIAFCLRTNARLIHISTNSIAGLSMDGVPGPEVKLTEQQLWIGQHIQENKYVYSKFMAEKLVLEAIAQHGLNAKIMRVGNLSARQQDGEFQINFNTNNFLALLRAYVVLGMVPYEALDRRFEFSPIDEVARAILLLATTPKECTVFHPCNTHRQFLSDILNGFAEAGITVRRVEQEEFQKALEKMMEYPDRVTLLRPLMAYNLSHTHQMRWIESTNDYTTQALYRLGFQWPITAADYVHRFVDTIVGFDYFNVK